MNTLEGQPLLDQYRRLLKSGNKKDAWEVVDSFFEAFDDEGPGEILWFMLTAAMKLDEEDITARHRSSIIFFYEYSIAFFRATYILYEQHNSQKQKQKNK